MKSKVLLIIFLFMFFIITMLLVKNLTKKQNQACFKNHCFNVELAKTPQERSRGLAGRKTLDFDKGMLFIFEKEGEYPFWMKDTLIPLDIIWINEAQEVVFISENAQPCKKESSCLSINPKNLAKYVLEVNGGVVRKLGLKIGDKITIKIK